MPLEDRRLNWLDPSNDPGYWTRMENERDNWLIRNGRGDEVKPRPECTNYSPNIYTRKGYCLHCGREPDFHP